MTNARPFGAGVVGTASESLGRLDDATAAPDAAANEAAELRRFIKYTITAHINAGLMSWAMGERLIARGGLAHD